MLIHFQKIEQNTLKRTNKWFLRKVKFDSSLAPHIFPSCVHGAGDMTPPWLTATVKIIQRTFAWFGPSLTSDLLHPSAYQIILWMANIHRYLQSLSHVSYMIFFLQPSFYHKHSCWHSSRTFSTWNGLLNESVEKKICIYLNGHWHSNVVGPIIRLLILMFRNRCEKFLKCVPFYAFYGCKNKYATLDRISLMHIQIIIKQLSTVFNRNLLNAPFPNRSMFIEFQALAYSWRRFKPFFFHGSILKFKLRRKKVLSRKKNSFFFCIGMK